MKRAAGIVLLVTAALAQQDRAPYQTAYASWRAADPNLERDAATGGATLGARADKVAGEAAKFYAARKAFLERQQLDSEQKASAIEALPELPAFDRTAARYVAAQSAMISGNIDTVANDPDRAIQRLRLALERERTTLVALSAAITDSQNGRDTIDRTAAATEDARGKVTQRYRSLSAGLKETAALTAKSGTLWADYYRTFSDEARGAPPRDVAPLSAPVRATPAQPSAPVTVSAAPNLPGPAPAAVPPYTPPPVLRTRAITPLPLSRYMGAWVYPTVAAEFHGPEPDTVDMIVHEENGVARGTIVARFKLSASNPADAIQRLNFEGPLQETRNQVFPAVTGKGAKGTVELIPGPAFNLIDVNITTEDKPGAIRQARFLLIKK